ncbi:hypothetical protein BC835DRAFT_1334872 [Cytidiella melzeri]|nr:hypothetical protein BC835DRAFT_1334872 [Cytidiella melzeri]
MSRRSKRTRKLREDSPVASSSSSVTGEATLEETNSGSDYEARPTRPASKVARKTTSKTARASRPGTRRRGKLQEMLDMPLDVILDICSHLNPKDLLNLARTSRDLREFFMSRNTLPFWKAARLNTEKLPPCPSDLSEPAYANLMFDAHCHNCLSKNCNYVYWQCRIRLCKSCRRSHEVSSMEAQIQYQDVILMMSRTFINVVPSLNPGCYPGDNTYYGPQLAEFSAAFKKTPHDSRESFLRKREELVAIAKEDWEQLDYYIYVSKDSRSIELDNVREGRREAIFERLRQEDWQLEIAYMNTTHGRTRYERFARLPEVRKAQALTPRIWNNIRQPIINFMHDVRNARFVNARRLTVVKRLQAMHKLVAEIVPQIQRCTLSSIEVALCIPEVSKMLEADFENFDAQKFQDVIRASIPEYLEKRAQYARKYFEKLFRDQFGVDASVDLFALAVAAYFKCACCNFSVSFDNVLHHLCGSGSITKPETMSEECYNLINGHFWNQRVRTVEPFRSTFDRMAKVIEACGLDVSTATTQDLDRPDIRLQCIQHLSDHYIPIMTWRTAVCAHDPGTSPTFLLATEEQVSAVKDLEPIAEALHQASLASDREFRCTHCDTTTTPKFSKEALMAHLKTSHDIAEPVEDLDWKDEHTRLTSPSPVYLVSDKRREFPDDWNTQGYFEKGVAVYFEFESVYRGREVPAILSQNPYFSSDV